jgi:transcriptional regulator with XRE-family HTH domain
MKSKALNAVSQPIAQALRKLGTDIAWARKRRRISTALMSERTNISRPTLLRLEKGAGTVSLGVLATVLSVLGLADRLADLVDVAREEAGLALANDALPKRIRARGQKEPSPATKPATIPEIETDLGLPISLL